jgi:hypothetical protein
MAGASSDAGADTMDEDAEAAAERLMLSVQRGFELAKAKGVPAATRLMKELRQVCAAGGGMEISLVNDSLQVWQVELFDWAFDESSSLHKDLQDLSEACVPQLSNLVAAP